MLWCDQLHMLMSDHMGISACLKSSNQSPACLNSAHQGLMLCKHRCSLLLSSVELILRQQRDRFQQSHSIIPITGVEHP